MLPVVRAQPPPTVSRSLVKGPVFDVQFLGLSDGALRVRVHFLGFRVRASWFDVEAFVASRFRWSRDLICTT